MNIPLAKREGGWVFSVHSEVIVIGNGVFALTAINMLSAHPVIWIGESAHALHSRVTPLPDARVVEVLGQRGNFRVRVEQKEMKKRTWIEAGTIVLALAPEVRLDPNLPQTPLIRPIAKAEQTLAGQNVAFYLNDQDNEYAFALALHQALRLAVKGAVVTFFYFNLRLGNSKSEETYQLCCQSGVRFLRLKDPLYIVAEDESCLRLHYLDPFLDLSFDLKAEFLYISEIYSFSPEFEGLASLLRIHSFSVSTNRPGIFVLSEAQKTILPLELAVAAIAGETALLLSGELMVADGFAQIDSERCSLCLSCCQVCPSRAIEVDRFHSAAYIDPLACQGCGVCASACSSLAISLPLFDSSLIYERIKKDSKDKTVIFACQNSGALAAQNVSLPLKMAAKIELVTVPCGCNTDQTYILQALAHGADNIILGICPPGSCASQSEPKTADITRRLQGMGLNPELVKIVAVAANSPALWRRALAQILRAENNQEVS